MINKVDKNANRLVRAKRIRKNLVGTSERPRLCVFKSLTHIYAQVIDDQKGVTIASASTLTKTVASKLEGKTKQEAAFMVGEAVAKNAMKKGVKTVVFDRAGNIYTGRVKALAEGARKAGLEF